MPPNKALQRTVKSVTPFAKTKVAPLLSAAELCRYGKKHEEEACLK